jgi:hypothetical protein
VYTQSGMEVFKNETREIIRRFKARQITFEECVTALADALANVSPMGSGWQMDSLRDLVLANKETLMTEMETRTPGQPVKRKSA